MVMINLSSEAQSYRLEGNDHLGSYSNAFTEETVDIPENYEGEMQPWQYVVLHTEAD